MQEEERIFWIDNVRVIACFCIVMLHVTAMVIFKKEIQKIPFQYASLLVLNSLTRFAVPVFFMISGILFLRKEYSITQIYFKYIVHLATIFVFWSIIYTAIFWHRIENTGGGYMGLLNSAKRYGDLTAIFGL